jgi:hypothetical protein
MTPQQQQQQQKQQQLQQDSADEQAVNSYVSAAAPAEKQHGKPNVNDPLTFFTGEIEPQAAAAAGAGEGLQAGPNSSSSSAAAAAGRHSLGSDDGLSIHPAVLQLPFHAQPHSQPGSAGGSNSGTAAAGVHAYPGGTSSCNGSSSGSKWFAWDWVQRRSSSGAPAAAAVVEEQQQQQQQQQQQRQAARSMRASLEDRLLLAAVRVVLCYKRIHTPHDSMHSVNKCMQQVCKASNPVSAAM